MVDHDDGSCQSIEDLPGVHATDVHLGTDGKLLEGAGLLPLGVPRDILVKLVLERLHGRVL